MNISEEMLEKLAGPISAARGEAVEVSLFVVSKKSPRLKRLDLAHLNPTQRATKLHQWAQDERFVAVIEIGDQICAYTHAKFTQQLQDQKDLSIDGKKVTVKSLDKDEYDRLNILGETLEEQAILEPSQSKKKEKTPSSFGFRSDPIREYFARSCLLSDQMGIEALIGKMENVQAEIIIKCLKKFAAAQREIDKRKEEAREKEKNLEREKARKIKKEEIQQDILTSEIKKEQIF